MFTINIFVSLFKFTKLRFSSIPLYNAWSVHPLMHYTHCQNITNVLKLLFT